MLSVSAECVGTEEGRSGGGGGGGKSGGDEKGTGGGGVGTLGSGGGGGSGCVRADCTDLNCTFLSTCTIVTKVKGLHHSLTWAPLLTRRL